MVVGIPGYIYTYPWQAHEKPPTSPPFSPAISKASGLALAPEADIQAPHVKSWESKGPIHRWESKGPAHPPGQIRPYYTDCWGWLWGGTLTLPWWRVYCRCSGNPRFKDLKGPFYLELSKLLCKPLCQVTAPLPNSKYPDNCNIKDRVCVSQTYLRHTDIPNTSYRQRSCPGSPGMPKKAPGGIRKRRSTSKSEGSFQRWNPRTPDPKNNGKGPLAFWGEARFVVGVGFVRSVGNLEQLAWRYQKLWT